MRNHILLYAFAMSVVMGATGIASPITLTFAGPVSGSPGSTVTLIATMTNTSGVSVSLGSDGFTLQSPLTGFDDSAFLNDWPTSLDASGPNASYGPAPLFRVTIPAGTPSGAYTNNAFNVLDNSNNLLASQLFEVDVVAAVPEPAMGLEIALVLVGLAGFRVRQALKMRLC